MKKLKQHIVLVMPSHSNFCPPIIENLKFHGYDVSFIDSSPEHLKKIKVPFLHKLIHILQKVIFQCSNHKATQKNLIKERYIQQQIDQIPYLAEQDRILVIRPDLLSQQCLEQLRHKSSNHYIGYQWNGLERFPETISRISTFDRFFVFDHTDLCNQKFSEHNLIGTTNFYFDMQSPQPLKSDHKLAYFVGLHFDDRVETLEKCATLLLKHNIQLDFNIRILKNIAATKTQYQQTNIQFISKNIEFDENIQHINQASLLVDILNPIHQGLSFRTFEALYYQKKLITSNAHIQHYDFFHPNNIFIWDESNLEQFEQFLAAPYIPIKQSIKDKYSFHNWLCNLLDTPPYDTITLPEMSFPVHSP